MPRARKDRRSGGQNVCAGDHRARRLCLRGHQDGGDDPDITTGSEVRARVRLMESDGGIRFLAGDGVGRSPCRA